MHRAVLHTIFFCVSVAGIAKASDYSKLYHHLSGNLADTYVLHERRGGDATKATPEDLYQPPFRMERLDTHFGEYTFRERVFLFTPNPPKHPVTGHWLLATLSGPVKDEIESPPVGRRAIWKPPGGDIYGTWESEEFMQEIAARHHITLPTLPVWKQPGRPPGRPTMRPLDFVIHFDALKPLGKALVIAVALASLGVLYVFLRLLRRWLRKQRGHAPPGA